MKKNILISGLLLSNTLYAAQNIQISATIDSLSPRAELIFTIDDFDVGKKTPYIMSLKPGQNFQMFSVEGDHYQITQWSIQAPHLNFMACASTEVLNNHSLIVNIIGKIEPNGLTCRLREVAVIPQLSMTPAPIPASTSSITLAMPADKNAANKTIANYLTALSKNCQKGTFIADFDTQSVTYKILGMNANHCDVTIGSNQLAPLTCRFNQNDIALLASPTEIGNYQQGTTAYSENSLSARIMKARCQAAPEK
jgi:hypothetical protein